MLTEAEGALERALQHLDGASVYADVMAEAHGGYQLRVERDSTSPVAVPALRGAVFRAWTGRRWAETVAAGLDPSGLERAVEALVGQLRGSEGESRPPPGANPIDRGDWKTPARRRMAEVDVEELIGRAQEWQRLAAGMPGISNAIANLINLREERLFRSTSGARLGEEIDRIAVTIIPLAIENGRIEYDPIRAGGTGGFELLDRITEEEIRAGARGSVELLRAGAPPSGRFRVLLDPSMAGVFAHESFGHGTEADQMVRERSYLKPLLGQVVGPEALTLVDDGSFEGGWGQIYFDEEGTLARRNVLVEKGRFVGALHDRESAEALHARPTGNARRADFLSRSFVRMTNTFVEPGDLTLEELLEEARDGILLESATSGLEDPLGGQMQLKCKRAHRIEHGRITTLHASMALSGKVLDFLRDIRGVGRREGLRMDPGFCGKGHTDMLPTGDGGCYLLSEAVVGPA